MTRDTQKSALYYAEDLLAKLFDQCVESGNPTVEVEGITLTLPPEAKFGSIASVQTYCDQVCDTVQQRRVNVIAARTTHTARYYWFERRLSVPDGRDRWAMRELVVLHELAHMMSPEGPPHGPLFVAAFIDLLTQIMGPPAGLATRLIYSANGIEEILERKWV